MGAAREASYFCRSMSRMQVSSATMDCGGGEARRVGVGVGHVFGLLRVMIQKYSQQNIAQLTLVVWGGVGGVVGSNECSTQHRSTLPNPSAVRHALSHGCNQPCTCWHLVR
jgi:hypothetical protein